MKRRRVLHTMASLYGAQGLLRNEAHAAAKPQREADLHDPYADVDWAKCDFLHSMSHQHTGQTEASRDEFYAMGYRHLAFSNYYPSAPTYPLPQAYLAKHPDVIGAPNAEQHSMPDASLHFNSLGSRLATGYGSTLSAAQRNAAPLAHQFDGLQVFNETRPWAGVYRLDLVLAAVAEGGLAQLTVEGAIECKFTGQFAPKAPVHDMPLKAGSHTFYFSTTEPHLHMQLIYDKAQLRVTQCRLMQGANRPWREVFRAALDGEIIDGRRTGGLLHADGGGITLNHPTQDRQLYEMFLDFDPRVLGIEVWNQLTSGFGSSKGFYDDSAGPHLHFYKLWDDLLRTGRRCWGFFVKDHNTFGRGRNVLLVPNTAGHAADAEVAALRAYRTGAFFGAVSAMAVNEAGEVVPPYDCSTFRFTRIVVRRDADGKAAAVEVAVTGNDSVRRPHVQIRFVTDQGVALVVDAVQAEFPLQRDADGQWLAAFVRVEAFAYPDTHLGGEPLTPAKIRGLNVHDISLLHDRRSTGGKAHFSSSGGAEIRSRIPIVDMIFSQPLRRV
ncbi:hypothetical protein [Prosthecobacter sp.]|uniref:hypothetical protein n=1 Tax=Prosthecobacter sp. TaxID=1965333 RepID=UPI00248822C1|nr:hypothetical protein [Prosthecobacter sp.]MDI1312124.1 hypothetical protein [Prosthecobacter sp.]